MCLKNSKLNKLHHKGLNYLGNNRHHALLIVDKNIGPCIANRDDYIAEIINQHFCNTNIYERITKEQSQEFMDEEIRIFLNR